ncbi:sugar phosphate isomerase/epimerase family protein [Ochrovirga pacifica]|uniref:sugar phosphate isomerase/epimerase family protein n=1 Tax=Ochrovirga pacifica TaxID=1042376 RepID=UPI000255A2CA|nr:TIM barrel protein [Ochrovirga pacifica]
MNTLKKISLVIGLLLNFSSCTLIKEKIISSEKEERPFYAYNFGLLEKQTPEEQITSLYRFGYSGITFPIANLTDIRELDRYIPKANSLADFKIYSVFFRYNFNQPVSFKESWKLVIDKIQNKNIDLWFVFGKMIQGVNQEVVEAKLREVVNYATKKGVTVVLYPHSNCYFYAAEQALPLVSKINSPNLKLAVHTCHEMRAGNGFRLDEVVMNVKEYIGAITIAGADKTVDRRTFGTMDSSTIQPLEVGKFDYAPFLKALKKIKYKGPVGFINFNIKSKPEDYLPKSLKVWREWESKYLN